MGRRSVNLAASAWLALCAVLWHLSTFENAADLAFFVKVPLFLELWLATHEPVTTVLTLPCDQMWRVFSSQQPILFEGCISRSTAVADVAYFADQRQNLFPPCTQKRLRHFAFVAADNSSKAIVDI